MKKLSFGFAALVLIAAAALVSQPAPRTVPGPQQDDSTLLVSGWKITPVGKHVSVDTLPMSTVVTPDGKYLLVLNGGYNPPSVSVIDTATMAELSRTRVTDGWLGLAINRAGTRVYVGGGSTGAVYEFALSEGKLTAGRTLSTLTKAAEGTPAEQTYHNFTGDVALSPDGRFLYAATLFQDSLVVLNLDSGKAIARVKTGRRPYRIVFLPDGKTYLVSNWADGTISQFQASDNAPMATVRAGAHPTDMLLRPGANVSQESGKTWLGRLFVAAANTNNVYSFGINEGAELMPLETINLSLTPREPLGMTPSALGLSADGKQLFVACSDANAVAVADISEDMTRVAGFIPTGWYPTAVRGLPDGRLVIANGKGLRSYPNPKGPGPLTRPEPPHLGIRSDQYVGTIQRGTISFLDPFDQVTLAGYSKTVRANSPYRDSKLDEPAPAVLTRIKHVLYVVKENRTYDQMLGDMTQGNGDPSLVLFGEKFTPNQHKLAREFVLFDNFYVSADVSADGHNWSTAAIASDYVQKFWPNSYAGRRKKYDYEGGEPAALPPANYLWTNARQRGLTMRNYGYFATNRKEATPEGIQVEAVRDPVLSPVTNLKYRAFDLDYSDVERVKVFQQDLAQFEQKGEMPQLMLMRLGNDHTSGTAAGKIAPLSSLADNDYALGLLVESVSKSRFWADTAIFVLEDDAQNGADHVDSHRSPVFVLSPYTRRGVVDSTMYNTTSVLRTMETILGIRPMTHFDAAAALMTTAFANSVNTPYAAVPPNIPLTDRNPARSATAALSRKMNFDEEDLNDDDELNAVLWAAIKRPAYANARAGTEHFPLMPKIHLCFLWHMHQPFYKDLISGEYKLPWTRLHALKDYYGMVKILDEFPEIRQTFNLVPSMMVQVEDYASGGARDPFLTLALKPAETLTESDRQFLIHHSFHAHPGRMIYRYPRYGELYERYGQKHTAATIPAQDMRDLQMLSQLAWFDEYFQEHDPEVAALLAKGRDYTTEDQVMMGRKQQELVGHVIPTYKRLAATGQIEISTTPFYHPILPLLCDSNIASIAHPNVPLPRRFSYPEDARAQLLMSREYIERVFGVAPAGLWPSEGSVSDEVFHLAAECGFTWAATDNGVLARTLGRGAGAEETYRPWMWNQRGHSMQVIFRDHMLSDLIGFVYSGMGAKEAAGDFLRRVRENCAGFLNTGRDALVPVILDGENAWEYYDHNGRPFFRELYQAITDDSQMECVTVAEGFRRIKAEPLTQIFPGSWINANFDIWIGAEEDNRAWKFLLEAREAYDQAKDVTEQNRKLAWEELLIAEGSDWCWWYGPEHESANRPEFDELFRSHIANVYRALGKIPPEDLSRPILRIIETERKTEPTGRVKAIIDGKISSYFEWIGAGVYHVDQRSGSMHGKKFLVREMHYGYDTTDFYLRIDFREDAEDMLNSLDCRFCFRPNGIGEKTVVLHLEQGRLTVSESPFPILCAYQSVLEMQIPLLQVQKNRDVSLRFNASFWHNLLPIDALPQQGWLEVNTTEWGG